ncbi:PTS sugar transporter subunit IIA [Akkermansiaceae bacterium]|nr:PTS sugar transporter subunit IIA [Akkermansiaceae bacterium]
MNFSSLLSKSQIILDMCSSEHDEAIVELINILVKNEVICKESKNEILDSLLFREGQNSTGIGSGIAIPHIFTDCVTVATAAFGRSKSGIEFDAIDNALVNSIFLLILPNAERCQHLQTLASISKFFSKADARESLTSARTKQEIIEILEQIGQDGTEEADC